MSICATILTGKRPELLRRTIAAIEPLFELDAIQTVWAYNWAGDFETYQAIEHPRIMYDEQAPTGLANGPATSECAELFLLRTGCKVWLHIEDDFEAVDFDRGILAMAAEIAQMEDVGQLRLREESHLGQLVRGPHGKLVGDGSVASNRNWVSGEQVQWEDRGTFLLSNAHATHNPFMMRRDIVKQVFWSPVTNERHTMDRLHAARTAAGHRPLVAQLRGSGFRHIGVEQSLEGHRW